MNDSERFWSKVTIQGPDKCWIWNAAKSRAGYGRFGMKGKTFLASRSAWEFSRGPIPEGLCVLHKCDNPPCVNPSHLFLGTHKDNAQDMIKKNRARYKPVVGEKHWKAKLTEQTIKLIVHQYESGWKIEELARFHTISTTHLYRLLNGKTWEHLHINAPKKRGQSGHRLPDRIRNEIPQFYRAGKTQEEIADMFGINQGTVSRVLANKSSGRTINISSHSL